MLCVYNMRREAERTLWSLSRAYQNGIEDLDYEVIVVENGSSESQKLGEDFVKRASDPSSSTSTWDDAATPSPVPALNRGIEAAWARTSRS